MEVRVVPLYEKRLVCADCWVVHFTHNPKKRLALFNVKLMIATKKRKVNDFFMLFGV